MKILLCGGNGAGKSTLGRMLSKKSGYRFMDIEEYYFPSPSNDYAYAQPRTKDEVTTDLLRDMQAYDNIIFSAVKGSYGKDVESLIDHAIYIDVPKEVRIKRVKQRSYDQFGERMLPGGDLHMREANFFKLVESRCDEDIFEWLEKTGIPFSIVDGTLKTEELADLIYSMYIRK
ncbi:MAG: hypothetical protein E7623_07410 [Ruminococcaceae bacterium]|nr:hypothetical protein [Oscillospiraceae bacterium]